MDIANYKFIQCTRISPAVLLLWRPFRSDSAKFLLVSAARGARSRSSQATQVCEWRAVVKRRRWASFRSADGFGLRVCAPGRRDRNDLHNGAAYILQNKLHVLCINLLSSRFTNVLLHVIGNYWKGKSCRNRQSRWQNLYPVFMFPGGIKSFKFLTAVLLKIDVFRFVMLSLD